MTASDVLIVQHASDEGPGRLGEALGRRGIALRVVRVDRGAEVPRDLNGARALVVLGGPMSAYESDLHPHLDQERALLGVALRAEVPVLGICLGSQLLASVLGAPVRKGPAPEIGWFDVSLSRDGRADPLFGCLPARFRALHWHGDVFDVPDGAVSLASSDLTQHQAFRYGPRTYGMLFHLEAGPAQIAAMTATFHDELVRAAVDPARLLHEARKDDEGTASLSATFFDRWASSIELS